MAMESIAGIIEQNRHTVLWAHPRVAGLFGFFFPDTRVITVGNRIARNGFERLLLMTSSFRSALLALRTGIRERTGFSGGIRDFMLTRVVPPPSSRLSHHSLDYEALAASVGCLPTRVKTPVAARGNHVAVFAGARYGGAKRWPGFGETASLLAMEAVFYGTEGERPALEDMAGACGGRVRTGLSIPELARELMGAKACMGNDSGGVHLAAALGVPTVAVFCSTSPSWTGPRGERVRCLVSGAPCSPCFNRSCRLKTNACLDDILPAAVAEAVRNV